MTRAPHDHWLKTLCALWLDSAGLRAQTSLEIGPDARWVDVAALPRAAHIHAEHLGQLGRLVAGPTLLEGFRNAIGADQLRGVIAKALDGAVAHVELADARMIVVTPSLSRRLRLDSGATLQSAGILTLPVLLRTTLIVVHELPGGQDTLWLRLLGRGPVQARAMAEVIALPETHPLRGATLDAITDYRRFLQEAPSMTRADQELASNIDRLYPRWQDSVMAEGLARGREEGRVAQARAALVRVLTLRGLAVAPSLQARIDECDDLDVLARWLDAAVSAVSAEDALR